MLLNELSFEIIQRCPNNCIYCSSISSVKADNIIGLKTFVDVVDDAVSLGLKRLCFSGGEPLLHPDFLNMVCYAKSKCIDVYIYTSGIVLDKQGKYRSIPKEMLLALQNARVDKLIFNMQAAEEDLYNIIMRTNGCFKLVKESIARSVDIGIFTEIHFVPMRINKNQILKIIDVASSLKVNKVSFLRFVLQGRAKDNRNLLELSYAEISEIKSILAEIDKENRLDIRVGIPLAEESTKESCSAGWGKMIVRYDGAVYPCEAFKYISCIKDKNIFPDNVNNQRFREICESSKFLNYLRMEIESFKRDSVTCETCPAQWKIGIGT